MRRWSLASGGQPLRAARILAYGENSVGRVYRGGSRAGVFGSR